jgi:Ran GTPase-activating protein (RanGAP) involved in mRNA processing and transport
MYSAPAASAAYAASAASAASVATQVVPDPQFILALEAIPAEDWCRTWAAGRTFMLRRTSKKVRQAVDNIRPPAVVRSRWNFWYNYSDSDSESIQKIEIMARGLEQMKERCTITSFVMSNTTMDIKSFAFLVRTLGSIAQGLLHLEFSSCSICDDKTTELIELLENCQALKSLVLSNNSFTTPIVLLLSPVLSRLNNLSHIDFTYNEIRNIGVAMIGKLLGQCPALRHVDLSYNDFGDKGATALANALSKYNVLSRLSINNCNISNIGAERLFGVLSQCPTLAYLELHSNLINDAGVCRIVEMLSECSALKTLIHLNISYNKFGSIGSEKIAEMLHNVPTLKCSYSYQTKWSSCIYQGALM